jgi:hypothetical protein
MRGTWRAARKEGRKELGLVSLELFLFLPNYPSSL